MQGENKINNMAKISGGERSSNLELFRIISMLVIVAHHYVVNSGLLEMVYNSQDIGGNDIFLLFFGWGGKTAINGFILITGYFMCKSNITIRKFGRLIGEKYFYTIVLFVIFLLTGYTAFELKEFVKALLPTTSVTDNFTGCFLIFYLFIPFINKLLQALSEKEHITLVGLCILIYTVFPSLHIDVRFNYVTWFVILYIIAAYVRMYPKDLFEHTKLLGILAGSCLLLSWGSVAVMTVVGRKIGRDIPFFFVVDSNKILALLTGFAAFMFFKNLKMKRSKIINTISASTFGVLLIHANSNTMRTWLWQDMLQNVKWYESPFLTVHAIVSVLAVYIVCTVIDWGRIQIVKSLKR